MSSLTLKNLPDSLLRKLRKVAEKEHRSLTQQVIHLLDATLDERRRLARSRRADMEVQVSAWRKLAGKWKSNIDEESEAARLMDQRTSGREVEL